MTNPTFFTVVADYKSVVVDLASDVDADPTLGPVTAKVTFTPILANGDVILATDASPRPTGYVAAPIVARIDTDGRLKLRVEPDGDRDDFASVEDFPLTGNTAKVYFAIDEQTFYRWTGSAYAETYPYAAVRLLADTALLELASDLYYRVSFSEVVFNGGPGYIAPFTFQAPSADVELNLIEVMRQPGQPASGIVKIAPGAVRIEDGDLVFSYAGVDIPDPVPLGTFGATETGVDLLTAADPAAARTAISAVGKGELVYNVKDYGAVGDGIANDRAAIHAARDAAGVGGTLHFPTGTYRVEMVGDSAPGYKFMSGGLQANVAGQTWLLGSAELTLTGTDRENLITVMAPNVSIIGGTLDLSAVPGAYYHNAAIGVFSGNTATDVYYGDHGTNSAGAVIRDVTINDAPAIGVWIQNTNSVTITGCTITNFYQSAIGVQTDVTAADLSDIVLHGNRIESDAVMQNSGIGIGANDQLTAAFVAGTNAVIKRVRITDNTIALPRQFRVGGTPSPIDTGCIEMFNVEDAVVDGNITDGSAFGITTGFLRNVVYSNNTCKGFRRIGLEIGGGLDGVNVVGNMLDSDGAAGPFNGTTGAQDPAGSERQVAFGILGAGTGYWRNLTITGNTITGFTTAARIGAISIANDQGGATLDNVVISGNNVTAGGGSALFTAIGLGAPSTNVTITGNTLDGYSRTLTTGIGVVNNTHTGLSITGNSFSNFDKVTDLPGTLTDVRFTGNLVRNCPTVISGSGVAGATRLLVDGLTGVTSTAQIELGHATDTTLTRSSAGVVAVEGVPLVSTTGTATLSGKSLSSPNIDGGAGNAFISTTSAATDASLYVNSKGLGSVRLAGGGVSEVFWAVPITSGVNYIRANAATTGNPPSLQAAGTDTNISLNLRSVGTGAVLANGVAVSINAITATHTVQQVEVGHATDTTITRTSAGQIAVEGNPVGIKVAVPATATSTGVVGQWAADSSWHYVCTAANTWVRSAHATW